jgi:hypothetical protein
MRKALSIASAASGPLAVALLVLGWPIAAMAVLGAGIVYLSLFDGRDVYGL